MATHIEPNAVHAVYDAIDPLGGMKDSAQGKTVLVTGAGRGIGQAIAKAFAQASAARLILTALEETELEETRQIIHSIRPDCHVFSRALDVRDTRAVEGFIQQAAEWSDDRIDVLCCNAGISPPLVPIAESDPHRWWMGVEVNLKGVYLFCRFVLPIMQKNRSGHIIITASRAAAAVDEKMSSYQISKLAVTRLCDCIDAENRHLGIKCFAIHPGGIITQLLTDLEDKETEPWAAEAAKFIRPRLQEDISLPGSACVFLASGKADFLSGRYVDTTISLPDICKEREAILAHDLFKIGISANWSPDAGFVNFSRRA